MLQKLFHCHFQFTLGGCCHFRSKAHRISELWQRTKRLWDKQEGSKPHRLQKPEFFRPCATPSLLSSPNRLFSPSLLFSCSLSSPILSDDLPVRPVHPLFRDANRETFRYVSVHTRRRIVYTRECKKVKGGTKRKEKKNRHKISLNKGSRAGSSFSSRFCATKKTQ